MQLANGCGSGTLYTAGGGSGRMLITLALFIVGSVIGSLHLPAFLALGGIDPVLAANYLGPWGGLAATLASIAAAAAAIAAIARARGASFMPRRLIVDRRHRDRRALGRRVPRRTPSLERDLRLHGVGREDRRAARRGFFRRRSGNGRDRSVRLASRSSRDTSSLTDFGMILGAMAAAAAVETVRAHRLAAGALASRRRARRAADGVGRAHRLRLQHRRLRRRRRIRLAARLDLVRRRARRLR